jgi:translation initiation factor eIF-2B subunit delta
LKKKQQQLKSLIKDNKSGSTELLDKLNKLIRANTKNPDDVKKIITSAKKRFKDFSAINNYLAQLTPLLKEFDFRILKDFTDSFMEKAENKKRNLLDNVYSELKGYNTLLTMSNSWTIYEVLKFLHNKNKKLKVIISESRPVNEGRILAKNFLKDKIEIEFITEAELARFIPLADAILIGADSVLKNGNVINKSGSKTAAILCKHFSKPFYVITTKDKFSDKESFIPEQYNPAEVWNYKNKRLKIYNYYFEEIERNLVTKIIMD